MGAESNNQIEKKETVDVIDSTGNAVVRNDQPLAGIFDAIEKGKAEGKSAADSIAEVSIQKKEQKSDQSSSSPDAKGQKDVVKDPVVVDKVEKKEPDNKVEITQDKKEQAQDKKEQLDDRAALKKQLDDKKDGKKQEAKEEGEELSDEELQPQPHDKPATVKRIKTLLARIEKVTAEVSTTKAEAAEKASKLAELEKKLGEVKTVDPKQEEELKKQREELAMFRRRYEIEKDPETVGKFEKRAAAAEETIGSILKSRGAGEELFKLIKSEGGWNAFAQSNRGLKLSDGRDVTHAQFADMIMQELPLTERKQIEAAMIDQLASKRERENFIKEETGKAAEYFKKIDEENAKASQRQQEAVQAAAKAIETWEKEVVGKTPWLNLKEVPANATAEERTAIEEDNKYTKQLRGIISKSLNSKTVEESLEVIMDSVRYYQERREHQATKGKVQALEMQLAEKQREIDKIKTAGKTVSKSGSISGGGSKPSSTPEDKKPKSLDEAFGMLARGESLDGKEKGDLE